MLNRASLPSRFEWSLHRLVDALGAPDLGKLLGLKPGYLSRMANPWDGGAFFRARDLGPALRLGIERLGPRRALEPLAALAGEAGCGIYPLPQAPSPPDVILGLSRLARAHGDLGERAVLAVDPRGQRGPYVSRSELMLIEAAGFDLASQVASVMQAARVLHLAGA